MVLSIAIVTQHLKDQENKTYLMVGDWATPEEAQSYLGSGSGETVIEFDQFETDEHNPNARIFDAIMSAPEDRSLGHIFEKFADFCFRMGRGRTGHKKTKYYKVTGDEIETVYEDRRPGPSYLLSVTFPDEVSEHEIEVHPVPWYKDNIHSVSEDSVFGGPED